MCKESQPLRQKILDVLRRDFVKNPDLKNESDYWTGCDDAISESPLGFDVNLFEGERGEMIVDVYPLKLNGAGEKEVDTSGDIFIDMFTLTEEELTYVYGRDS